MTLHGCVTDIKWVLWDNLFVKLEAFVYASLYAEVILLYQ